MKDVWTDSGTAGGGGGEGCSDGIPEEALVPINGLFVTSNIIVGVNKGISVVHSGAELAPLRRGKDKLWIFI